ADIPLHLGRYAADLVARAQAAVEIGQAVVGIAAGRIVAAGIGGVDRVDQRIILAGERALGPADAHEHGAAAFRVLLAIIARQRDAEIVVGLEQQLAANAQIVLFVDPAVGR